MRSSLLDLVQPPNEFNRTALIYHDGDCVLEQSYSELRDVSERLCDALTSLNVEGHVVALAIHKHRLVPAVILGVLKARSAFLYIDTGHPVLRNKECLAMIHVSLMITDQEPFLPEWRLKTDLKSDALKILKKIDPDDSIDSPKAQEGLAYVVFTSGSTGAPKAVQVHHQCITPNITDLRAEFNVTPDDTIFMASPFTFDPSIVDLFLAFSSGAKLVMVEPSLKSRPIQLAQILHQEKVSIMQATPSLFLRFGPETSQEYLLRPASVGSLRILVLGGEPFPCLSALSEYKAPGNATVFYNIYGVTEVSCWATLKRVDFSQLDTPVDLGRPLSETVLRVVDEQGIEITRGEGALLLAGQRLPAGQPDCVTGDQVELINGLVYYRGRMDGTVKRMGKRVNLHAVELIALASGLVRQCCALIYEHLLVLASVLVPDNSARQALIDYYLDHAAPHERPDEIVELDVIPVTSHGKTDKKKLLEMFPRKALCHQDWNTLLAAEWKKVAGDVHRSDANFILSGGNSLSAVVLSSRLEEQLGRPLPGLIDVLLNRTLADVQHYLRKEATGWELPESIPVAVYQRCRPASTENITITARQSEKKPINFKVDWTFDLKKCIDASPLVIQTKVGASVFLGSHSHRFASIDLETGKERWSVNLPDRIESSACCDASGSQIFVGCYDGGVYSLDASDGQVRWKFQTGDAVKSSPVCTDYGSVLIGSHDRTLYCLKAEDGLLLWSRQIASGSLFASPAWNPETDRVFVASLDGTCASLEASTGKLLWSFCLPKPVFSSPAWLDSSRILVASVDGLVHCLNAVAGHSLWAFQAGGPIFSSLTTAPGERVLFGCHDHSVYCLNVATGQQQWRSEMTAPVYSSPFFDTVHSLVFCVDTAGCLRALEPASGSILGEIKLNGQIFSSPVLVGSRLMFGCRDDLLYCVTICE